MFSCLSRPDESELIHQYLHAGPNYLVYLSLGDDVRSLEPVLPRKIAAETSPGNRVPFPMRWGLEQIHHETPMANYCIGQKSGIGEVSFSMLWQAEPILTSDVSWYDVNDLRAPKGRSCRFGKIMDIHILIHNILLAFAGICIDGILNFNLVDC